MRELEKRFLDLPEVIEKLKDLYSGDKNIASGILPISIVDTEKWARCREIRHKTVLVELNDVDKMVEKYKLETTSEAERDFLEYIFESMYSSIGDIFDL